MPTKSKIQDQTFLFTGTLTEFTREEAETLVGENGGKVLSGVSAKLNYLVVGADAGSKLAKAKALKTVSIITEKEFLKMVPKGNATSKKTAKSKKAVAAKKETVKASAKAAVSKSDTNKVSDSGVIEEVQIGNQIWMVKNLDVIHFRNGDKIPEAKTDKEWEKAGEKKQPAWCYHDNDPSNGKKYGKLYNFYAVNDPRGLSPKGYHIPSDDEWEILIEFLGGKDKAGKKMKFTDFWEDNGAKSGNGTNVSGFSGLPGGIRSVIGTFGTIGKYEYWWSSSEFSELLAWYRRLGNKEIGVYRDASDKSYGFSIRCIKD